MKTRLLAFLFFAAHTLSAQITFIPDSIFEEHLINLGYDNLHNGWVLTDSVSSIDTLIISGYPNFEISDLSGIEDFYNLQYLDCSKNNIDTLNINTNTTLKYLDCYDASISELIIDNLHSLSTLDFSFNNLTNVNLSGNPGLTHLNCIRNQLSNLNLSNNTFLASLKCGDNILTSLDLSMVDLEILQCQNNPITNIDLSGNYSLKHLTCHDNLLQQIDLSDNVNLEWLSIGNAELMPPTANNDLTALDLSNNCNITNFYCSGNLNLICIQICTSSDTSNWASLDSQMYYSLDCNYTSVDEVSFNKDDLISIIDIYGREVNQNYKGVLFYIYKNGKVEKRITLYK
tara:strand:+ start:58 stop:1089 length:1032 start_codon:yes stop_codon:yes gene_type:complete